MKKKPSISASQRCLDALAKEGWQRQTVEKWIPKSFVRQDLFGIIDIIAIKPGLIMGVQATTITNFSAHVLKAEESPMLRAWLEAGAMYSIWGWRKRMQSGRMWFARRITYRLLEGGEILTNEDEY